MKLKHIILGVSILILFGCDEDIEEKVDEAIIDISGKVTDDGQAVASALVFLVESAEVAEGFSLANGSITNSNGEYVILNPAPGDYYILAVEDHNGNMEFEADTDRIGFYGVDPNAMDIIPDLITVSDQDLEDIDIVDLFIIALVIFLPPNHPAQDVTQIYCSTLHQDTNAKDTSSNPDRPAWHLPW